MCKNQILHKQQKYHLIKNPISLNLKKLPPIIKQVPLTRILLNKPKLLNPQFTHILNIKYPDSKPQIPNPSIHPHKPPKPTPPSIPTFQKPFFTSACYNNYKFIKCKNGKQTGSFRSLCQ